MHPTNRRVQDAVEAAGITPRMVWLDEHARTAALAAEQIGCEVAAIANSLVFDCDGEPLLVMASGAARVDTDLLARTLGATRVERAGPDFVRSATGMAIGGVAPAGHPSRLRALVDTDLAAFEEVWAAGGTPDTVMALTFEELVRLTGGTPTAVR
ncbi:YbaK/EbsC family protein [Ornithinimicrobium tianjinense]|uniref:Aminoacyl-tRNA deacylase n=1 Tax=Ornithinimicrobium tianjinense TaxID=1195761 RepID=A0A917F9F3_9MICO|nr:YbaK/EbsC family protein [Ornithinimicrobium tianjinense]GGF58266.1 aminoacyl-tRNA deacylase [Ornithinimicrobium tianjinense]